MAGDDQTANDPWERQDSETTAAFSAFAAYRDMGPARSITKVARQLGKSRTLIGRWSRAHAWVLRAQAFDREQDRIFAAEQRQARKETARRHAKLAQAFLGKAVARLQILDPRELSPAELLRYFATAADIERRAVGDNLGSPEHAVADGGGAVEAEALTDEERKARMEQLRRELERRIGQGDTP
ncbi:hypothetical protein [Streptomyces sp. NPDC002845]